MSPEMEQLSAKGTATDIWSAGVIFGTLLNSIMGGWDGFGSCEVEPRYVIDTCEKFRARMYGYLHCMC